MKPSAIVGVGALLLVGIALSAVAVRGLSLRQRHQSLTAELQRRVAEHASVHARWAPKPLRGESHEGDMLAEQLQVADQLKPKQGLFAQKDPGCAGGEEERTFLQTHAAQLGTLRQAARASSADTPLPTEYTLDGPASLPLVRVHQVLIAAAALARAADCLAITADAIRLAQAVVPGAGLDGTQQASVSINRALIAMSHCARRASRSELVQAGQELSSLLESHPSLARGDGLEREHLESAGRFLSYARFDWLLPTNRLEYEEFMIGGQLNDAAQWFLDQQEQAREIGKSGYPKAAELIRGLAQKQAATNNPLLMIAEQSEAASVRDQTALARMRITSHWLKLLTSNEPRAEAAKVASLEDPYSGLPLRADHNAESGVRVWSVGPNGQDDAGAGDDIAVTERSADPCSAK
jgi:hypothetical protein